MLYSHVMERPKIFLMGINPGSGYCKWHERPVQRLAPRNTLEYVEKGMDYVLAKETRDVFIKADLFKYLEKQTVKSNIFYFSTNNTADLWKLMSIINNNIDDHYTLAHNWTRRLLAMTKPEIILCEGKKAFDELITCLG